MLLGCIDEVTNVTFIYLFLTESYSVAQASLKLGGMLQTQPSECQSYRHEPPPYSLKIYIFVGRNRNTDQISNS